MYQTTRQSRRYSWLPVLSVIAIAVSVSGCGTLSEGSKSKDFSYDPATNEEFSARPQAAQVTSDDGDSLVKKGYLKLGGMDAEQDAESCTDTGASRTCAYAADEPDPTGRILSEAAARGADLVQLTANNEQEEQALYKEICTQWTEARTPVQVCGSRSAGGGCYTDMQKIKSCSAFSWASSPYDYRYYRRSAGTIWRYAPELAMTERLLVAVKEGDEVTVRELLPVVVNPNVTAGVGHESLLITALRGCQWSIAELLLSEGVDPTNVGSRAVKATVSGGTRKADREYCQDHREGIVPTMRLLRSHGVDIKDGGEDALTTCALSGRYKEYVEAAKFLLDAGVDPNVKIEKTLSDGQSKAIEAPLSNAVPHTAMVKILLDAGANPNIEVGVTTPYGNSMTTPLEETRRLCNEGNYRFDPQECAETIKLLTAAIGQ